MRTLVFIAISIFITSPIFSQSGKQLKAHKKAVAESALKGTSIVSLDTLFCSGKAVCMSRDSANGNEIKTVLSALRSGKTLLTVRQILDVKDPFPKALNLKELMFQFHPLNLECTYTPKPNLDRANAIVCHYGLVNTFGLDTVKAEMFYTVHGKNRQNLVKQTMQVPNEKTLVAMRDTTAPIEVVEENIMQGGVLIASFERDSIEGPGGQLQQLMIYNSVGALVCTATCTDPLKGYWSFLTYSNNRFHTATLKRDNDLSEVVRHLMRKGIL